MGIRTKLGWAGGVNLLVDPNNIRADQLAGAKNCWPTVEGIMAKREAMSFVSRIGHYSDFPFYPLTLFKPDPVTGYDYILDWYSPYTSGSEYLSAVNEDMTIQADANLNITVVDGYQTTGGPASMVNYRGRVIAVNGQINGYMMFYKEGNTWMWRRNSFAWLSSVTGVTHSQSQSVEVLPRLVTTYRGRLVFANFGPGRENTIVFADRNPPVDWSNTKDAPSWSLIGDDVLSDNGRNITFEAIAGESIRAIAEVSMSSATNPLQTALLILTQKSAIICTGEPSQTSDSDFSDAKTYLGDFNFARINFDCGAAGPYAICRGPNGTFWANGDDVYALYDGMPKPVAIGTNIRPALQACPPAMQPFWHMAYSNGAVYLSVCTQATTDFRQQGVQHWRLDLRPTGPAGDGDTVATPTGPSIARWWGPMDYESAYLLGGSTDGVGVQGALSSCIVATRNKSDRNVIYGAFYGDVNSTGDKALNIVSFNEVAGGRDVPYKEVSSGLTWAAGEAYVLGDVVMATPLARDGRLYVCTIAGTSGGTEPIWPDANGLTIIDGGITWTEFTSADVLARAPNRYGTTAPRIAMEPDFKELEWGSHMTDKLAKRADISAYFSTQSQLWLEILVNGGNNVFYMGPAVIGSPGSGQDPAYNELGSLILNSSSVAEEYEARQLRPSASTDREKPDSVTPAVVRGRTMQPCFREGDGFVIDDTNDYIVAGDYTNGGEPGTVVQGQLTHGYYANATALLTEIVAVLNAAGDIGGFTQAASPWSNYSAFDNAYPYMTTIRFAFSARTAGHFVAFFVSVLEYEDLLWQGVTYYTSKCARLLAMLGYDITQAQAAAGPGSIAGEDGTAANIVSEQQENLQPSPTRITGTQSIPYTRSPIVAIGELEIEVVPKRGRPMPNTPRTS